MYMTSKPSVLFLIKCSKSVGTVQNYDIFHLPIICPRHTGHLSTLERHLQQTKCPEEHWNTWPFLGNDSAQTGHSGMETELMMSGSWLNKLLSTLGTFVRILNMSLFFTQEIHHSLFLLQFEHAKLLCAQSYPDNCGLSLEYYTATGQLLPIQKPRNLSTLSNFICHVEYSHLYLNGKEIS